MKLLVIADDFTGALDTGVQFARAGGATMVAMDPLPDLAAIPPEVQVLAVNTGSRHMTPAGAAETVGMLAAAAARHGVPYLYKKTDSALRGNIGAELKAVMDAFGGGPAMFVPAFPKAGRTTARGRQLVNGVPLERTAFARDPLNPTVTSVIADILRSQADLRVRNVPRGSAPGRLDGQNTVYVFDGETDGDLEGTGRLLAAAGRLHVTAGCAGFASRLAALLPLERHAPARPELPGNALLVCGSVNESSLRQMEHAGSLGFVPMAPEAGQLTDPAYWDTAAGQAAIGRAAEALDRGGRLAIQSTAAGAGRLPAERSEAIAESLGKLAGSILQRARPCTLVAFGGDTAMAIMMALGCTDFTPIDEVEPGVALSILRGRLGGIPLISKAGGLGSEDVVRNIIDYIGRQGS